MEGRRDGDAPAGAGPLTQDGCLSGWIDRILLPGKPYYGNFDPEGLLGVIPATVTAMLGMFTGEFIRLPEEKCSGGKKTLLMLGAAAALIAVGLLWSLSLPLNKKLWTSTFVLVVGGISIALYALVYYLVEVKGHTKLTFFFRVIGLNHLPAATDRPAAGSLQLLPGRHGRAPAGSLGRRPAGRGIHRRLLAAAVFPVPAQGFPESVRTGLIPK